jgi:threonine/homoserine/homoserine lactone efflux protein
MIIISALIYVLPSIIAILRGHSHTMAIIIINLLLGWTLIGWIVVFLWAVLSESTTEPIRAKIVEKLPTKE